MSARKSCRESLSERIVLGQYVDARKVTFFARPGLAGEALQQLDNELERVVEEEVNRRLQLLYREAIAQAASPGRHLFPPSAN